MIQLHSFGYRNPVAPGAPTEDFLPMALAWHSCWKSVQHQCPGLFLDSQFCSGDPICIVPSVPHHLNYCSFVYILKSGRESSLTLFFLEFVLVIWGPLRFHENFRISLTVSPRLHQHLWFSIFKSWPSLWVHSDDSLWFDLHLPSD